MEAHPHLIWSDVRRAIGAMSIGLALMTPPASASVPGAFSCESVFNENTSLTKIQRPVERLQLLRPLRTLINSKIEGRHRFDHDLFQRELESYLHAPNRARPPLTPESKLALFEASAKLGGKNLIELSHWLRSTDDPKLAQTVLTLLNRLKFENGLRPSKVEEAFTKLYLLSRSDPVEIRELISKPLSKSLKRLIIQRAESELGSKSVVEAFENLGFLRPPSHFDHVSAWIRRHHKAAWAARTLGGNLIADHILGVPFYAADFSALKSKPIPTHLRAQIYEKGVDALYPKLYEQYGLRAGFDIAWYWGRRAMMLGLIGYLVTEQYMAILPQAIPEHLRDDEDGPLELTIRVVSYWYETYKMMREFANFELTPEDLDFSDETDMEW